MGEELELYSIRGRGGGVGEEASQETKCECIKAVIMLLKIIANIKVICSQTRLLNRTVKYMYTQTLFLKALVKYQILFNCKNMVTCLPRVKGSAPALEERAVSAAKEVEVDGCNESPTCRTVLIKIKKGNKNTKTKKTIVKTNTNKR